MIVFHGVFAKNDIMYRYVLITLQKIYLTDDSISCSICKKWYHVSCVNNVTEDQFNSQKCSWLCPLCLAVDFSINT